MTGWSRRREGAIQAALVVVVGVAAVGRAAAAVEAEPIPPARFAVIVGVNDSVDKDAPSLRYADDDAAGFLELFRALGARTYLLSRFDNNTRRLYSQAAAEAQEPRRRELGNVLEQVAGDVAKARARNIPTVLYFVYAGHGKVADGRGYLALEDSRLFASDIADLVVDRVQAGQTHIIVDACYSVFLALGRGPGGESKEVHGFSTLGGLAGRANVGLLLSTSSARESHEWSEFQAGVFSHEIRSGLLGAADADGDGQITYREIAAFVDRANAPVPNEKFRPDLYVKEPSASAAILDLRPGLGRRLELGGDSPGHYFLEDARGVRIADFNNALGQSLHLIRLANAGPLFLRRVGQREEYVVDAAPEVVRFGDLRARPSTTEPRGAAGESFRLLFSLPFSQQTVDVFVARRPPVEVAAAPGRTARDLRRPVGVALVGLGAVAAVGATWAVVSGLGLQDRLVHNQAEAFAINQDIDRRNTQARWLYGLGVTATATGALLLLWPRLVGSRAPRFDVSLTDDGSGVTLRGSF